MHIPQDLPRIREAIFSETYGGRKNPFNTGLQRHMVWTQLLLQHICIARASLFSDFCPSIEALSLPVEEQQWDPDGMPQFVLLHLELRFSAVSSKRHTPCHAALRASCVHSYAGAYANPPGAVPPSGLRIISAPCGRASSWSRPGG